MAHYIKRKEGWAVRFYTEIEGRKEQIYLYKEGWEKRDAEKAMNEYKYQADTNQVLQNTNATLQEFIEEW